MGNWYQVQGATVKKYYYAGNQRVAMRNAGALYWLLGDHLGSTAYTINGTTESGETRYFPWGKDRFTSGATLTSYKFTGQREEAGVGLYYYGARWYDPALGRFIQPDTIVPNPGDVQSFDRYAYVNNNPLRYTDPTGHVWETVADVVSVGYDAYDIYQNGLTWENGVALAVDVGGAAVPFMPSAGTCVRWCDDAWQYGSKAVGWIGDKADEGWQAAKGLIGWSDEAAQYGDEVASAAKASADCLVNSFSADTLVMTPSGLKPIAELVEGELVLAYNEATGQIEVHPITDTISHIDPEIVLLTIDGETLETTAEHPFYKLEPAPGLAMDQYYSRWTDAIDLKVDDLIWQADGTTGIVESVKVVPMQQRMYNLTVAVAHTFFVGEGAWLVHNDCDLSIKFFNQFSEGQGFSAAIDLTSGRTSMLPSTSELSRGASEVRNGVLWVPQYGGHAFVGNELIEQGASRNNMWGYVGRWTGQRIEITSWNSGVLNNPRSVPVELRSQIVDMLRRQTGLEVVDTVR